MSDGPDGRPEREYAVSWTWIVYAKDASDAFSKLTETVGPDRVTVLPNLGQ